MTEFLGLLFSLSLFALAIWLALIPWNILNELRRQGEERRHEAEKIIALLIRISGYPLPPPPPDQAASEASRLQSILDSKSSSTPL